MNGKGNSAITKVVDTRRQLELAVCSAPTEVLAPMLNYCAILSMKKCRIELLLWLLYSPGSSVNGKFLWYKFLWIRLREHFENIFHEACAHVSTHVAKFCEHKFCCYIKSHPQKPQKWYSTKNLCCMYEANLKQSFYSFSSQLGMNGN